MSDHDLPAVRISDDDRAMASRQLETAFAEGRLDADELASRLKVVNRAKFRSDLDHTLADLPVSQGREVAMHDLPTAGLQGFVKQYSPFFVGPIICTLIYAMTNFGGYFWPMWVWFGCAVPIIIALLNGDTDDNEAAT